MCRNDLAPAVAHLVSYTTHTSSIQWKHIGRQKTITHLLKTACEIVVCRELTASCLRVHR